MSPAYASASDGVVERGVQTVQGQVRVLRSAVEEKWGVKLETAHSIWPWLVEYASFLISIGEVDHDGKTPYERCKAKRGKLLGLAFGAKVFVEPPDGRVVRLKKWLHGRRKGFQPGFLSGGFLQQGDCCEGRGSWRRLYDFWPSSGTSGTPKMDGVLV